LLFARDFGFSAFQPFRVLERVNWSEYGLDTSSPRSRSLVFRYWQKSRHILGASLAETAFRDFGPETRVQSDKKNWAPPKVASIKERIFEQAWTSEKLMRVRDLVQDALELLEADEAPPDVQDQLREILAEIDAELASDGAAQ
jgi:hypothetical protein